MWRQLERTETELLREASRWERDFPTFYRDASNTWTATEEDIVKFYEACEYLYGIFDEKALIGLLYYQRVTDTHKSVHFDMKRGADKQILFEDCRSVRDDFVKRGTLSSETWVLRQNRPIQKMLTGINFRYTGLEMRAGSSHGKPLRWVHMVTRREYDQIEN